jgi:hypothetical protein
MTIPLGNKDAMKPISSTALLALLLTACSGFCLDRDGDGACEDQDCDDEDISRSNLHSEIWYDGIDGDCLGGDDFDQDGDGFALEQDCDDLQAEAYPGNTETFYDGVDGDCLGGNDYDQDGDGYELEDDCDDTDAELNPGQTEIWYDGKDQDCDGNDDDQDEDGVGFNDDCDDLDENAYPGNEETYYDGIDGDCLGGDDFDQDEDGFQSDAHGGEDCNDLDATIHPEALETLGDTDDSDCDGSDEGARWTSLDTQSSEGIQGPRLAESNGQTILVYVAQDYSQTGMAGLHQYELSSATPWQGPQSSQSHSFIETITLKPGFDFLADDDYFLSGVQYELGGDTYFSVVTQQQSDGEVDRSRLYIGNDWDYVDLHASVSGTTAAFAHCGSNGVLVYSWGSFSSFHDRTRNFTWAESTVGTVCGADAKNTEGHIVDIADETYNIFKAGTSGVPMTEVGSRTIYPYDIDFLSTTDSSYSVSALGPDGFMVSTDDTESVFLTSGDPYRAAIAVFDETFYAAYTTKHGDAYLVYGTHDSALEFKLDTGLAKIGDIDVFVNDDENLVIAVSGNDHIAFAAYPL